MDRALSGRSTSCSYAQTGSSAWWRQRSQLPKLPQRAAAVVVAASVPSRPGKGRPRTSSSKKAGPKAPGKPHSKTSPTPPQPKGSSRPGGPSSAKPASTSAPIRASSRLPRPASLTSLSISTPPVGSQVQPAAPKAIPPAVPEAAVDAGGDSGGDVRIASRSDAVFAQVAHMEVKSNRWQGEGDVVQETDVGGDGFLDEDGISDAGEGQDAGPLGLEDGDDEEEAFPEIQFNLPNPTNVKVKTAEYLQSCVTVSDCPMPRFVEFAVIGRSNVGKSSLINMVTGRKDLALVSKQPGKTKCINHFLINGSWYLVDLPGYGFAKVGLQGRQQFDAFTREYFKTRPNLAMVFMLVDASIPPQKIDLEYANWLTDNEVPFTLVFTKVDKRRKGVPTSAHDSNVTAFKRALLKDLAFLPPSIVTSSAKGLGRGELLNFIAGLRIAFERSGRLAAIKQGML